MIYYTYGSFKRHLKNKQIPYQSVRGPSSELQLNKAYTSDAEDPFLYLHLSISNDIVSTKMYDKRDDFDFKIVNFQFLDGDIPRSTSYGVYISQLIRLARASSHVAYTCNKLLAQKLESVCWL